MIPEIDISRAALMLKRYGENAELESATRVDEFAAKGDFDGVTLRRHILHAVAELSNTASSRPAQRTGRAGTGAQAPRETRLLGMAAYRHFDASTPAAGRLSRLPATEPARSRLRSRRLPQISPISLPLHVDVLMQGRPDEGASRCRIVARRGVHSRPG